MPGEGRWEADGGGEAGPKYAGLVERACGRHVGVFLGRLERLAATVEAVLATPEGRSMPLSPATVIALADVETSREQMLRCPSCRADYQRHRDAGNSTGSSSYLDEDRCPSDR